LVDCCPGDLIDGEQIQHSKITGEQICDGGCDECISKFLEKYEQEDEE